MILKIDSTKKDQIIVELLDAKSKLADKIVEEQKLGSQILLPMVVKILKQNKKTFSDLGAIEVNVGPGSFTGTRVGAAIANALGFALNIPVNGLPRGEAGKKGKMAVPVYEKSKFDA